MQISFNTKNRDIDDLMDKLTKYPVVKVTPNIAQTLSRHKKIRYLSRGKNIYIKQGVISLPPNVKIMRKGNGYSFDIF